MLTCWEPPLIRLTEAQSRFRYKTSKNEIKCVTITFNIFLKAQQKDPWTCRRLCCSKVLTVQVGHTDLLQFVHFRYCRSPSLKPALAWFCAGRWNLCGFTGSFVGLLSASASLCCANPCKALCFSDAQPREEMFKLQWTLERLNYIPCRYKSNFSLVAIMLDILVCVSH